MEFGIFDQLPCAEGQTASGRYADIIAQAQLADELGFDAAWLAELHFNPSFSVMSSPLMVASAIAQVTKRIKIGTAVNLVPLHHPIRLAEEVATLDVISQGRAIFGIGRGAMARAYQGYGVDQEESRDRFTEALDFILGSWKHDEFSYQGNFYQAEGVRIVPRPIQQPHPPVYIASNSPDTFGIVGSLGHNILVAPVISTKEGAMAGLESYRKALTENGHDVDSVRVNINVPVFVGEDRQTAEHGLEASVNSYLSSLREGGRTGGAQRAAALDYQRIADDYGVIGDPAQCVDKLELLRERYGAQEFMCWFNIGGLLSHQEVEKSMRLFAEEVMPHFR